MFYVADKAKCKCSKGSKTSSLPATRQKIIHSDGKLLCTILDHKNLNFGKCKKKGSKCNPKIVQDFQEKDSKVYVEDHMLLLEKAKLKCAEGGEVSITVPMNSVLTLSNKNPEDSDNDDSEDKDSDRRNK